MEPSWPIALKKKEKKRHKWECLWFVLQHLTVVHWCKRDPRRDTFQGVFPDITLPSRCGWRCRSWRRWSGEPRFGSASTWGASCPWCRHGTRSSGRAAGRWARRGQWCRWRPGTDRGSPSGGNTGRYVWLPSQTGSAERRRKGGGEGKRCEQVISQQRPIKDSWTNAPP